MPYTAAIFDLFGTLIDENPSAYATMMDKVARLLDVTTERLYEVSAADAPDRDLGVYDSVHQQFSVMCSRLGVSPTPEHFAAAIEEYSELQRWRLVPRAGVIDTLAEIKARGLKRGLITNTSQVIADIWSETAFPEHLDASILSVHVKLRKPDPAIYLLACNRLGVDPADCLYVGDGGANELTGAADVGMTAVLIATAYDDAPALGASRQAWDGTQIASIPEVLELL
jgi:putative hydrolase of the HAD superfamily